MGDSSPSSLDPDFLVDSESLPPVSQTSRPAKVFKFFPRNEIELLKEICIQHPFNAKHGEVTKAWADVAKNCGNKYSGETARRHFNAMMVQFNKEDTASLKRSGTEEEYSEKMQLLQDLKDVMRDMQASKDLVKSKASTEQESREKGEELRRVAMESLGSRAAAADDEGPRHKRSKQDRLLTLMDHSSKFPLHGFTN